MHFLKDLSCIALFSIKNIKNQHDRLEYTFKELNEKKSKLLSLKKNEHKIYEICILDESNFLEFIRVLIPGSI